MPRWSQSPICGGKNIDFLTIKRISYNAEGEGAIKGGKNPGGREKLTGNSKVRDFHFCVLFWLEKKKKEVQQASLLVNGLSRLEANSHFPLFCSAYEQRPA